MTGPINVLIVDDDETDRYIARRQLSKVSGIGLVMEADDGSVAFDLFESGRFDAELGPHPPRSLVLLDINMPAMSGLEFLERVTSGAQTGPDDVAVVVLLTSSNHLEDRARAGEFDCVGSYIEKPLTSVRLQQLLDEFWPDSGEEIASTEG